MAEDLLEDAGITGFTLRAFMVPCAANWANLQVMLYPGSEAELRAEFPLCDDVRFPGVQLFKVKFPLGPPAMLKWGQPLNPAVLLGAPVDDFNILPVAADFSRAISALFRTVVQPDVKNNIACPKQALGAYD